MDLGSLRTLAVGLNFTAHGVPATVTPPNEAAIETQVLWVTPVSELEPRGAEFGRRAPIRIAALMKSAVPRVPRGTLIMAPEQSAGEVLSWRVDGTDRVEADHTRVMVVPA